MTTATATRALHIAYVLKGFPRLSETFIANELLHMQSLGAELRLFSIKAGEGGPRHATVARIRTPVRYLPSVGSLSSTTLVRWLREHLPHFEGSQRYLLRHAPRGQLRALAWALRHAWRHRGDSGLKKTYIKEFLQAGEIAADLLRQPGPRLIHAHFCHDATNVAWMASLVTGIPFSFTAHAKDIYQARLNPGRLLADKIAAARVVVTCTEANRTHLHALAGQAGIAGHAHKVHRVYHGLDVEAFRPAGAAACACTHDDEAAPERPLLLAVGRLVAKKGFIHLLQACALLRDRGIEVDCAIVGERGDAQPALEQALDDLQLHDRVRLVPPMVQEQLRALYARATVFALPSIVLDDGDRDGIPNVLAEAMAMGIPVVSTPISGIPELIRSGENGLLVPERDATALADAVARLLADGDLRTRLAVQGRSRVLGDFDAAHTHATLHQLFAEAGA